MKSVVAYGSKRCDLAEKLRQKLFSVASVCATDERISSDADVVVICGEEAEEEYKPLKCNILITPSGIVPDRIRTDIVITYGLNSKDTVTLSSIQDDKCVLALQRTIATEGGRIVESQEIPLRTAGFASADILMAYAATLLALGIPPDKLRESTF